MQAEVFKAGWLKQGSVIAFPYEWQRPAKTEEWVFETLIKNNSYSPVTSFICFPWATLIDLIDRQQVDRTEFLLNVLRQAPSIRTRIVATACQHINIKKVIPIMKQLGITDLYWSHKSIKISCVEGIRIHPLPLYPVAYYECENNVAISFCDRKYKVSFIGAFDPNCYLSDIRGRIFNLKNISESLILKRSSWHFDSLVYKKQILNLNIDEFEVNKIKENSFFYAEVLRNSMYSLCPSGSGVNTIRLWESICFGCHSVILSDDYDTSLIKPNYRCIKIKENELDKFIAELNVNEECSISEEVLVSPEDFLTHIVEDFFDPYFVRKISTSNEYNQ